MTMEFFEITIHMVRTMVTVSLFRFIVAQLSKIEVPSSNRSGMWVYSFFWDCHWVQQNLYGIQWGRRSI